jgi:hypothetical protein
MLCVPGHLYFIPRLILRNTNGAQMQVDILTLETLPYFYAALSRNDLSYVAGEFRIFGAIFLKDGRSFSNVTSASLSSATYAIASFSTLSGAGLF